MSQQNAEPDPTDVRSALATLVADEPTLPSGVDDIERRGRRRLARRRLGWAAGAVAAIVGVSLGATALTGGGTPAAPAPVAVAPAPVDGGPAGGSQLAQGFTVDAALRALGTVLPAEQVGDLPMDIGWREGGHLSIPVVAPSGTLTLTIAGGTCTATVDPAGAIGASRLDAIADAICAAWRADGSPAITPAGPAGPEQPDLAAQ
jgi:hypothetical protein